MKGWVLYRRPVHQLTLQQDHAMLRLLQEAQVMDLELSVYAQGELSFAFSDQGIEFFRQGQLVAPPDFVICRRGSATTPEMFLWLEALAALGVCVINSADGIACAQDKLRSGLRLLKAGLSVPKTWFFNSKDVLATIPDADFIVLKKSIGSQGQQVMKCARKDLEDLFGLLQTRPSLLLQELIASSEGRDLRVLVAFGEILGVMERSNPARFQANVARGARVASHPLTEEIQRLALKACASLGLDIAGVDLLFDRDRFLICEVNSSPGFQGLEWASGQNIARSLLEKILRHVKKGGLSPPF